MVDSASSPLVVVPSPSVTVPEPPPPAPQSEPVPEISPLEFTCRHCVLPVIPVNVNPCRKLSPKGEEAEPSEAWPAVAGRKLVGVARNTLVMEFAATGNMQHPILLLRSVKLVVDPPVMIASNICSSLVGCWPSTGLVDRNIL